MIYILRNPDDKLSGVVAKVLQLRCLEQQKRIDKPTWVVKLTDTDPELPEKINERDIVMLTSADPKYLQLVSAIPGYSRAIKEAYVHLPEGHSGDIFGQNSAIITASSLFEPWVIRRGEKQGDGAVIVREDKWQYIPSTYDRKVLSDHNLHVPLPDKSLTHWR